MTAPEEHRYAYSYIFRDLVADENDLLGMVAYATYKRSKIGWLEAHKAKHGREPTPDEVELYNSTSTLNIDGYKAQAEETLQRYMNTALGNLAQEISDKLNANYSDELERLDSRLVDAADEVLKQHGDTIRADLNSHRPGWIKIIGEHVIAGIVATVMAGLLVIGLSVSYKDGAVKRALDALINVPPAVAAQSAAAPNGK